MRKKIVISLCAIACITSLVLGACGTKESASQGKPGTEQAAGDSEGAAAGDGIQADSIQADSMEALADEVFGRIVKYDAAALCDYPVTNDHRLYEALNGSEEVTADTLGAFLLQYWTEKGAKLTYTIRSVDEQAGTAEVECTYAGSDSFYDVYLLNAYSMEMTEDMDDDAFELACMKKAYEEADQTEVHTAIVTLTAQKTESGYELQALSREFSDVALAGLLEAEDANAAPSELNQEDPEDQVYQEMADNLQYEVLEGPGGVAIRLTGDQEDENVEADFTVILLDEKGNELDTTFTEFNFLPKGETQAISVVVTEPYSSLKVSVDTSKGYMTDMSDQITWEKKADNSGVTVNSHSDSVIERVTVTTLYYKASKYVGCNTDWIYDLEAGASIVSEIVAPLSISDQETVDYDSCEVLVTAACSQEMN